MQFTVNTVYLAFLVASAAFVHATDNEPCVHGSCFHNAGDNVNTLVHSLSLAGPQELISDVTPAAGWNIQGCNPDWDSGSHTVQMACEGTPNQTQHCNHLFTGGAEGTVVRLPQNCGKGPFARVVSINQTDGVHTMQLDYNFKQIPPSKSGNVTFELAIGNAIPSKTSAALQPRFTQSINKEIPFGFSKTAAFYNNTLNCSLGDSGDSASLNLAIAGTGAANGTVNLVGMISGAIGLHSHIDEAFLSATISGTASLSLEAEIELKLSLSTGNVLVATEGIPGFDIPGLFVFGPSLNIFTKADMIVDLQVSAQLTAEWDINNIGITWPSSAAPPTMDSTPKSSNPIHLSVDANVQELTAFTGHIIPQFSFGINFLDGFLEAEAIAEADIFLDAQVNLKPATSKRDHPRDLEKRDISACVLLNAGWGITGAVTGALGPIMAQGSFGTPPSQLQLYNQCFDLGPDSSSQRRDLEPFQVQKRDLQCPDAVSSLLQVLV